ncbi:hypothetical protein PLANPX_3943 [Lacipirellula parvula]|uniref:Uncharacterized protein n=1 Tax=Lacipirellula parvula TaxID=2650471 RepID=A0A5K7XHA7_9BACT|nr:hypothetical protein PLANPX_3943 [Lacipirellula parvula]
MTVSVACTPIRAQAVYTIAATKGSLAAKWKELRFLVEPITAMLLSRGLSSRLNLRCQ